MIKNLEIKNFKSIKHLNLDCKRVNIFIGKPNTGKSNILESVGVFSVPYGKLKDFIQFENMTNLFYDQDLSEKIEIIGDGLDFNMVFENGQFVARARLYIEGRNVSFDCDYDFTGGIIAINYPSLPKPSFKFYRFAILDKFPKPETNFLLPPRGESLLFILQTNKTFRKIAFDIFNEYGLSIRLTPQESKMEVQKQIEYIGIFYPYSLVSDTLQRVVFHLAAIETNKDSVIIFEEPEAHAFPFYTKFLAERIALDKTNQYFISTHNPYFLLSVLEKTPKDDIGIFITYFKDYQTKVRPLTKEKMPEILDLDASVFFNLDRFLEEE